MSNNYTVYMVSKPELKLFPLSLDGVWEGGGSIQLQTLLTLELHGGEWSAARPGRFIPG